jgi:hypothetical protein
MTFNARILRAHEMFYEMTMTDFFFFYFIEKQTSFFPKVTQWDKALVN